MRRGRGAGSAGALSGAAILLALSALSVARAATEGPRVDGSASGELTQGGRLVLRIDAAEVGGWQGLHLLDVSLVVDGKAVETISYNVEAQELGIGAEQVFAGTGGLVAGSYLRVSGAQVVVTPTNVPADSPESYYSVAKRIAAETPNSFYLNQYHNADNVEAHYRLTAPEVWEQTGGRLDAFVCGLGTGGTMSGCGKFFKEKNAKILNVGADPVGSVYFSMFKTGKLSTPHVYKVEGIGEDMMCGAMDLSVLDDVRQVTDAQAFAMTRRLAREEGLFCGISSGCNVAAALKLARRHPELPSVVTILNDTGQRYFTTPLCGEAKHVDIPEREHPLDPYTAEQLDRYQKTWEVLA